MDVDPGLFEHVVQVAHRLLARADHHIVDLEHTGILTLLAETDVQPGIVDLLVVDPGQLGDLLGLEGSTVHPPRGLTEPLAQRALLALTQIDLANCRGGNGFRQ
ncbi:Uncharacterised protein [Mycobacteroides abscessus subsp. abscessus]|nr:Uncharacterised protein [Mycobacteroides abscessus subsp. abscessus]